MGRHVLVWDAPNIDKSLATIIDDRPTASDRPDLAVLGDWLLDRAGPDDDIEACVFLNVAAHVAGPLRGWTVWLLEQGFRVFAKPKNGDSDIDRDMIDHLWARHAEGDLDVVYVGSNDAKQFVDPLLELVAAGVEVNVLGFSELAGELTQARELRFVDLETIEDLFEVPLPRITLEALPPEGRWFEPIGVLGGSSHLA